MKISPCSECHNKYPASGLQDGICVECTLTAQEARVEKPKHRRVPSDESTRKQSLPKGKAKKSPRKSAKQRAIEAVEESADPGRSTAEKSKQELIDREKSRRFLLPFIQRFDKTYNAGWFHKDLCRRLEQFSQDVADRKSPRLMLFVPPRHGKSITTTKNLPAWHLGHHPDHEFIIASYASQLAEGFSRGIREIINAADYKSLFPRTKLKEDSRSVQNWKLTRQGGLLAAGVGGPMTGNGAHILVIDDPVKNAEEADSATVRDSHWDWYRTTAYTRLAPGAGVLFIMTRWHHDDLAGRLLEAMADGGEQWDVVDYPAIALENEPYRRKNEALHPVRYDEGSLARIRSAVGERTWWSLYQQKPTPDEGSYFKREMIRYYDKCPPLEQLRVYTAWDFAIGVKEQNDFTVGIVVGVDFLDRIFILDVLRGKWSSDEIIEQIFACHNHYLPQIHGMEHGQISMAILPFLRKREREERNKGTLKKSLNIEELKTGRRDKVARARTIQGRMEQGMVMFDKKATWIEPLIAELLQFPSGTHDDQVDSLAWIGLMFDSMGKFKFPKGKSGGGFMDKIKHLARRTTTTNKSSMAA